MITRKELVDSINQASRVAVALFRQYEKDDSAKKTRKRLFDVCYLLQGIWIAIYANEWENMRLGMVHVIEHWDDPDVEYLMKAELKSSIDASECKHRLWIQPAPLGQSMSQPGWACRRSGGHCNGPCRFMGEE